MRKTATYLGFILIMFLAGCKQRYEPNLPIQKQNFLVVEGFINANGPTRIKLSRTVPIDQKKKFIPETNAKVWVEADNANPPVSLLHTGTGNYTSSVLLNPLLKYRIRIKTTDSKEYLSQFTNVKLTPAIDSINWKQENGGVQIYANAHDVENKTRYYKWEYEETWEIRSVFPAFYIYANGIIRLTRPSDPPIFNCWKYAASSSIIIGSSIKLQSDVIHLNPILFITRGNERLGIRYSILVRQSALDKEGYAFFEQMKKNTESLGTIFDPQPSAIKGNIQCVNNPEEIVIGYVHVSTVHEKRIFISDFQLSGKGFNMADYCYYESVKNHPDSLTGKVPGLWPFDAEFVGLSIDRYYLASPGCVDCRERGGSIVKPVYW